jgi:hypothetical protein
MSSRGKAKGSKRGGKRRLAAVAETSSDGASAANSGTFPTGEEDAAPKRRRTKKEAVEANAVSKSVVKKASKAKGKKAVQAAHVAAPEEDEAPVDVAVLEQRIRSDPRWVSAAVAASGSCLAGPE